MYDIKAIFVLFPSPISCSSETESLQLELMFHEITLKKFPFYISFPSEKSKIRVVSGEENENVPSSSSHLSLLSTLICMMLKFFALKRDTLMTQQTSLAAFCYHLSLSAQREAFELKLNISQGASDAAHVFVSSFIPTESCMPESSLNSQPHLELTTMQLRKNSQ